MEPSKGTLEVKERGWKGKRKAVECSLLQMVLIFIVFCIFTTSIALMVHYLPDRSSIKGTKSSVTKPVTESTQPATSHPMDNPYTLTTADDLTTEIPETPESHDPMLIGRLPRAVLPRRYLFNVRPYLYEDDIEYSLLNQSSTFDGWVQIKIECMEVTDEITLHTDTTLILHGTPNVTGLDTSDDRDLLNSFSFITEHHFLILQLSENLQPRKNYEIFIQFSGLMEGTTGFYISEYRNKKNEKRLTATTQMEGTYARRTLPCFDEPDLKASFDVRIEHRQDMIALSNGMEINTVELDDHWSRTYFKRVAAMPTFLLAMVVHDFKNISVVNEDGCLIRVWMQPDYIDDADAALNKVQLIQERFSSLLDMKYSLDKLDHIGVKKMGGAMENWGLIIYNENRLHEADDQYITHELGHQWFGNVVTMEWWDDLWLSEGFTSYMEHIGIDLIDPNLNAYENFYGYTMASAISSDAFSFIIRALKSPVSSERKSIEAQFTNLPYVKGGSIAFMMKHFLADGVFETGVQNYLKERAYKNANVDHLWEELTYADKDVGNHDMKKIMDTWTLQAGVPIVTLNRTNINTLIVKQERLYTGFMPLPEPLRERYYIPLTYVHKTDPTTPKKLFLQPEYEETIISLDSAAEGDWYLANYLQTGYYYVNYDAENWQRILDQAKTDPTVFAYQNQIGLLDQTWDLSFVDLIPREINMLLRKYFENTTREAVLISDLFNLNMLQGRGRTSQPYLQRCILDKLNHLYEETGWSDDTIIDPLKSRGLIGRNRLDITSLACCYGNDNCVKRTTEIFKAVMENPQTHMLRPKLQSLVYCNGIRYGGLVEWNFVWGLMQDVTDYWEKTRLGIALTCSVNISAIKDFIEILRDSSEDINVIRIITSLADNPIGQELAWNYMRKHWDWLYSSNAYDSSAIADLIQTITSSFSTDDKLQELLQFGHGQDFGPIQYSYDMAETTVRRNIYWIDKLADVEERFLREMKD